MLRKTPSTADRRPPDQRGDCSADDCDRESPPTAGERSSTPSARSSRPKEAGKTRNSLVATGSTRSPIDRGAARGQTSIDFVVGMSVFLLTVAFVVAFLPGMFGPFTATGSGDVLAADRTAGLLAEQTLADPTNPGVLNATCTAEFFSKTDDGAIAACGLGADSSDLDAALGLGSATGVNVTIERGGTVRSKRGVTLAAGPEPPVSESVVVSRRVVLLGGDNANLYVRMW
ncbi:hypothetical protein M0R89_13715 [Halorussus limi]|uniref:Uncharacterized protein n=1 Tax=Halorussus limi TaxID=2938695 RepID=A0A8U0HRY8_9EURY|nr:hypothetical protein [Halorussus limi]UPV73591.1 hypothetical protein M0R89_13715 [Halorussus limi]